LILHDLQGLGSLTTIWRHLNDIWNRQRLGRLGIHDIKRVEFCRKILEEWPIKEDYRDIRYFDKVHISYSP
jgi:hypothetical protein